MEDLKREWIELTKIRKLAENPNVMSKEKFEELCQKIQDKGFDQEIKVYWNEEEQVYEIVKGNHRYDAAVFLGLSKVPCVVGTYESRDHAVMDAYSDNVIRGDIDPEIFSKTYNDFKKKYGPAALLKMLNVSKEDELKKLIKDMSKTVPKEKRSEFKKKAASAESVEELSSILTKMFDEYGETLDLNFMYFNYGGEVHLTIQMSPELKEAMEKLTDHVKAVGADMSEVLYALVANFLSTLEPKKEPGGEGE